MHSRKFLLPLALSAATLLAACNQGGDDAAKKAEATPTPAAAAAPADDSKVVATVNGSPITEDMLQMHLARLRQQPALAAMKDANLKKAALEALVNQQLLVQEAEKEGLDKKPEIVRELDQQRRALLGSTVLKEKLAATHFTDEQLKAEYDKLFATPEFEYKARHILLNSEKDAQDVIAQLKKGADFAKLAKEKSIGPSKSSGGELGWVSPKQVVPEFGAALATLDKGGITESPVKTQFGWHVIELEDKRKVPAPDFDKVKPQIQQKLQRQALTDYIDGLRKDAKVDIKADAAATDAAKTDAGDSDEDGDSK